MVVNLKLYHFVVIHRNEMLGVERSFLEAEYHCHDGYKLIKKFKRKTFIKNKNLICKKRRWIGQRPTCKEIKSRSQYSAASALTMQQCDIHEARKCEQLCTKGENSTEATCYCHKGFRLIGTRCFGNLNKTKKAFDDAVEIIKNCLCFYFRSQILMNAKRTPTICAEMGNVSIHPGRLNVTVRKASG